jgi:O-antigen/teichoic acid export membrane protein
MYILGMGTGLAKKNHHYTIAVIAGAILNTLLNYLLIPPYGVAGAAYATLAGNLLATVYMFFAGQHYFKVFYDFKKIFVITAIIISAAVFGICLDSIYDRWTAILVLYKLAIIVLTLALFVFSKVLTLKQFQETMDFFQKKPLVSVQEASKDENN